MQAAIVVVVVIAIIVLFYIYNSETRVGTILKSIVDICIRISVALIGLAIVEGSIAILVNGITSNNVLLALFGVVLTYACVHIGIILILVWRDGKY